jgi:hypothetical protein
MYKNLELDCRSKMFAVILILRFYLDEVTLNTNKLFTWTNKNHGKFITLNVAPNYKSTTSNDGHCHLKEKVPKIFTTPNLILSFLFNSSTDKKSITSLQ